MVKDLRLQRATASWRKLYRARNNAVSYEVPKLKGAMQSNSHLNAENPELEISQQMAVQVLYYSVFVVFFCIQSHLSTKRPSCWAPTRTELSGTVASHDLDIIAPIHTIYNCICLFCHCLTLLAHAWLLIGSKSFSYILLQSQVSLQPIPVLIILFASSFALVEWCLVNFIPVVQPIKTIQNFLSVF